MLTFLPLEQIDEMDKWEGSQLNRAKEILAFELTEARPRRRRGAEGRGQRPRRSSAGGSDDANMPTTELTEDQLTDGSIAILDLMLACKLVPSKGEGRRLVQQGGVMVNEEKVSSIDASFTAEQLRQGLKIRKGKKVYHKAVLK